VPFLADFILYAKRPEEDGTMPTVTATEAKLRLFCVLDDPLENTLHSRENFKEIAVCRDVEVSVHMGGKLLDKRISTMAQFFHQHNFHVIVSNFVLNFLSLSQCTLTNVHFYSIHYIL